MTKRRDRERKTREMLLYEYFFSLSVFFSFKSIIGRTNESKELVERRRREIYKRRIYALRLRLKKKKKKETETEQLCANSTHKRVD